MNEQDPYAPPASGEEVVPRRAPLAGELAFRVMGAMCGVGGLISTFAPAEFSILGQWEARMWCGLLIYGFVRGGKGWHLGITIYLCVGIIGIVAKLYAGRNLPGVAGWPVNWSLEEVADSLGVALVVQVVAAGSAVALWMRGVRKKR